MNIFMKLAIGTCALFVGVTILTFTTVPQPYKPGDVIQSPQIQKFGDGYAIAAGGCTSCITLDKQLSVLKGKRVLIIFIQGSKQIPSTFSGHTTASVGYSEFTRINPTSSIPRLLRLHNGTIISMQRQNQTYQEYVNEE